MRLLTWLAVNTLALGLATWLFDGITITGDTTTDQVVTLVAVGAIFGVITSFVRPFVRLLSLPLIVLTLGLMLLVINALMLMLTSWLADKFDLGFHVDGFWVALWGSVVISIALILLEAVLPGRSRR